MESNEGPSQTALLPHHQALINLSKYLITSRPKTSVPFPGSPDITDLDVLYKGAPGQGNSLTQQDITDLKDLYSDLDTICQRAQERGVRIIIDAEHRCVPHILHPSRVLMRVLAAGTRCVFPPKGKKFH